MPKTYLTPSASKHSTKTSDALRSLTPPPYLTAPDLDPTPAVRRALAALLLAVVICLTGAAGASAAGVLQITAGGDGHGIGMSQYGAEGYAEHGATAAQILAHYFTGTALGTVDPHQTVRVLLTTHGTAFAGATAASAGSTRARLNPADTYAVSIDPQGRLVLKTSGHPLKTRFAAPLTVTGPAPLQVAGRGAYRGSLQYAPDGHGGVQTVDLVGLDDYVRGVVAAEMPAGWLPAALQAQAIAARTYAVTTTVAGSGYDLYDDTRSQMYGGVGAETAATDAAVAATTGQVVTYGGHPVVTYFFASSGGHTESIQNVWPGASPEPWLVGVPDPYDGADGNPYHLITRQLSLAAAGARLGHLVRGALRAIRVTQTGVSGRIIAAQVIGTRGTTTASGTQLAAALNLPTTLISFATISAQPTPNGLSGLVAPAPSGGRVTVQAQVRGGWRTVGRPRVGRDGRFSTGRLPAGHYRVQAGRLTGPAISLLASHSPVAPAILLGRLARAVFGA
jgi:stage II sporulation protein D